MTTKIKIGITGLSTAGKTAFITSLVHNLELATERFHNRDNLKGFKIIDNIYGNDLPRIALVSEAIPDSSIEERFPYRKNLKLLIEGTWPPSTGETSVMALDIYFKRKPSFFSRSKSKSIRLEIMDYPGEWLLDFPLLDMNYNQWCRQWLGDIGNIANTNLAIRTDLKTLLEIDSNKSHLSRDASNEICQNLNKFKDILRTLKEERKLTFIQPCRFDDKKFDNLLFIPLRINGKIKPKTIGSFMNDRFEKYKDKIVKPFVESFKGNRFHIILVDVINAYFSGPDMFKEIKDSISSIMSVYSPNSHTGLFKKVEKIAILASKVDLIPECDEDNLKGILGRIASRAKDANEVIGSKLFVGCVSSVCCTNIDLENNALIYNPLNNGQPLTENGRLVTQQLNPNIRILQEDIPLNSWDIIDIPKMMALRVDALKPIKQKNIGKVLQFLIGDLFDV